MGHRMIAAGGTFECRLLSDSSTSTGAAGTLQLQASDIHSFYNISEIVALTNRYYWKPQSLNFPVVDGIQLPNRFYQYTVSLDHPIVTKRFEDILQALNLLNSTINLYFVVPESIYSRFKKKHYGKADKVEQRLQRVPSWTNNVYQYVVKLKMTKTT